MQYDAQPATTTLTTHTADSDDNKSTQLLVQTPTLEVLVKGHDNPDESTTTTTADDESTTIANDEPHYFRSLPTYEGEAEATPVRRRLTTTTLVGDDNDDEQSTET